MNIKRVTVLYNLISETKRGNENEKLADDENILIAKDVSQALENLGYDVTLFELNRKSLGLLSNIKTDLIFNLLEGFDDIPNTFPQITMYLEALGIPITGATSLAGQLTIDKARTKDYLVKNRIPTPNYQLFINDSESLKYNLRYPLITKPNSLDSSLGITQDSVVKNFTELRDRILFIKDTYKDATLAEEYIDGRELEVLAIKVAEKFITFPILEGIFIPNSSRKWDICDFNHKWLGGGYCDEKCPADLSFEVVEKINNIAKETRELFDIHGYFRIDIRLSKDDIPYVVEVNTNPGADKASLISKLTAGGVTYEDFVQMVVDASEYDYENKIQLQRPFLKDSNLIES